MSNPSNGRLSPEQTSFKELVEKFQNWFYYLKKQFWKILIFGIIGGAFGLVYALIQTATYSSKTTFIVEDSKGGPSIGGLASIAGQFGVDLGGGAGGGLIEGDNILLYFKSESLAREVLLSTWDQKTNESLADKYAEVHRLKEDWKKDKRIGDINFTPSNIKNNLSRLEDSLLQVIINDHILKKQFSISKIDKKAGFIQLIITMQDESLAKIYSDRLLDVAVQRYISLKTNRQQKTVDILQKRADSISNLLNRKTSISANLQTAAATMDLNPLYKTSTAVETELTTRDKTMLATVYGEVIKNLELAKFTLSQETPVIQIVDNSKLPLPKKKILKSVGIIQGIIIGLLISIIYYSFIRWYKKAVSY